MKIELISNLRISPILSFERVFEFFIILKVSTIPRKKKFYKGIKFSKRLRCSKTAPGEIWKSCDKIHSSTHFEIFHVLMLFNKNPWEVPFTKSSFFKNVFWCFWQIFIGGTLYEIFIFWCFWQKIHRGYPLRNLHFLMFLTKNHRGCNLWNLHFLMFLT